MQKVNGRRRLITSTEEHHFILTGFLLKDFSFSTDNRALFSGIYKGKQKISQQSMQQRSILKLLKSLGGFSVKTISEAADPSNSTIVS